MPVSRKRKRKLKVKPKLTPEQLSSWRNFRLTEKLKRGVYALLLHNKGYSNKVIADVLRVPKEEVDFVWKEKE